AFGKRVRFLCRHERCGGVGNDHARRRSVPATQNGTNGGSAFLRSTGGKVVKGTRAKTKILRGPLVPLDFIAADFTHKSWPGQAYFIEAVVRTHQEGPPRPQLSQRARHGIEKLRPPHAEELIGGAGGIGERTQAIEERTHLEAAADRGHVKHGWVKVR